MVDLKFKLDHLQFRPSREVKEAFLKVDLPLLLHSLLDAWRSEFGA